MNQPEAKPPVVVDHELLARALQRSEARRVILILVVLAVTGVFVGVRNILDRTAEQSILFRQIVGLLVAACVYAVLSWLLIRRAVAHDRLLPAWFWALGTVVEAVIPTIALLIIQQHSPMGPLETVAAPALLLYGVFTVASVLRLRPWLSILSGALAAGGHVVVVLRLIAILGPELPRDNRPFFFSYAVFLALTGAMAALVSREVRRHLYAALREAETRRLLDLVQNEMEIARTIQQKLMPTEAPDLPGFDIAGWNRPASRTGGDYYDWQLLPDGRLAVVIADVTGHGLGPALLMAVCRAYARACVPAGPELGAALSRVNALLHGDVSGGRFVTLAIAIVDPRTGQVELLSAGHGPMLHLSAADGKVDEFHGDGLPLGLLVDESYTSPQRLTMAAGDVLLLVTDGFVEWARAGDGELYGVARLRDFLRNNAKLDPADFIQHLAQAVEAHGAGSAQADDMTAVVIRRR